MRSNDDLFAAIHTALDPDRFFAELRRYEGGRSFLSGEADEVSLTRGFLEREAGIARTALDALEEVRRRLALFEGDGRSRPAP